MGRARTFWASGRVCVCMLWTFSNLFCNLRIGSCSFSILVTKLSECSFHEKWSVHAHFGLACARVHSEYFQTLHAILELVHLHFLFWWPSSQITPSKRKIFWTKNWLHGIPDGMQLYIYIDCFQPWKHFVMAVLIWQVLSTYCGNFQVFWALGNRLLSRAAEYFVCPIPRFLPLICPVVLLGL